jgi:hypothetical protein
MSKLIEPGNGKREASDISWRVVAALIMAFAISSPFAVDLRSGCSFPGWDGAYWAEFLSYQSYFTGPLSFQAVDPLQGMFDAYPNAHFGYLWISVINFLTGSSNPSIPIVISTIALFLCLSTFCISLSLGLSRATALLSGLVTPLITYSYYTCYGIDGIFALSPQVGYIIAIWLFMMSTFQVAGLLSTKWLWLPTVIIVLIATLMVTQSALDIAIVLPAIFVFGFVILAASDGRLEFLKRLIVAVSACLILFAMGMPNYFLSFGANIDTSFYYDHLVYFTLPNFPSLVNFWHDYLLIVLRVNPHTNDIQWITEKSVFVFVGYVVALVNILTHKSRTFRAFSIGTLIYVHVIFLMYFIAHYSEPLLGGKFNIPNPYHFLYVQYSVSVILVSGLLQTILSKLWIKLSGKQVKSLITVEKILACLSVIILTAGLTQPFYATFTDGPKGPEFADLRPGPEIRREWLTENSSLLPGQGMKQLRENEIVKILKDSIGLNNELSFRGTVATFTGQEYAKLSNGSKGTDYTALGDMDTFLHNSLGNEMRHIGLWRFLIPTFYHASSTRTAQYTYLTTAFLTHPLDRLTRHWVVLTRPNKKLLALWGARFIITDFPLTDWKEVARISINPERNSSSHMFQSKYFGSQNITIYLYENSNTNLADYSPIKVEIIDNAEKIGLRLADPKFDPRITVIVTNALSSSTEQLIPVTSSKLEYVDGHLHLSAYSLGESLLVLPAQFTNCWTVSGKDAEKVELFRANFLQLGIRFRGDVDVHLSLAHRPFWHHNCRNDDARDLRKMGVNSQSLVSVREKLRSRTEP